MQRCGITIGTACLMAALGGAAPAQTLTTYGTPGLIDMPVAEALPDGQLAFTTSHFGGTTRNTASFQITPRLLGTFRYSVIQDFQPGGPNNGTRYDRSFDLHYMLASETPRRPSLAVGLRDFGGTGIYSGEYLVATKHFGQRLKVTAGMGWGRLAQRGGFRNPLSLVSDRFKTRPSSGAGGLNTTGQLDFGSWFRGPAAIFGGLSWQASDRMSLQLEYSTDAYDREVAAGATDIETPFNLGLTYDFKHGSQLRAFVIGGREVGLQYSYAFNPGTRRSAGGLDNAPRPLAPRNAAVLASWGLDAPIQKAQSEAQLKAMLAQDGLRLHGFESDVAQARVWVENLRWDVTPQALGRTARALSAVLPASVTQFQITLVDNGVPQSTTTLNRDDLIRFATHYDGAWESFARSQISDGQPMDLSLASEDLYPQFSYGIGPYVALSFFDPDEPLRADVGAQLSLSYRPRAGLSFDGVFRYPFVGNIDKATRVSNSVLPRVRSDAVRYAQDSELEINQLTAAYTFRPGADLFGRVTVGYLENMYAGVSGEVLWYPIDSRLALGAELNYVRQRDFDMLFGLQDYSVVTGHASAYFDHGNGFTSQMDVGRYLAGDWGVTFGVDRAFNNGFKVGGYFTLTDVSFDDFGEGSFDKGIRVSVPLSWLTGRPSKTVISQTIQPVLRDGGARVHVPGRLYDATREARASSLNAKWGRFYR